MNYKGDANCCNNVTTVCAADGLARVILSNHSLTGIIPQEFNQLERMILLDLSNNPLDRQLSTTILQKLNVSGNDLTSWEGTDPSNAVLKIVDISNNKFDSLPKVPSPSIQNLEQFIAANNPISMNSFPSWLTNAQSLKVLNLNNIQIQAQLFPNITGLIHLTYIRLENCSLTGGITSDIKNFVHLKQLLLDGNALTGPIPSEIAKLTDLTDLDLRNNDLDPSIPPEITQMPNYNASTFFFDHHPIVSPSSLNGTPTSSAVPPPNSSSSLIGTPTSSAVPPPNSSSSLITFSIAFASVLILVFIGSGGYLFYHRKNKLKKLSTGGNSGPEQYFDYKPNFPPPLQHFPYSTLNQKVVQPFFAQGQLKNEYISDGTGVLSQNRETNALDASYHQFIIGAPVTPIRKSSLSHHTNVGTELSRANSIAGRITSSTVAQSDINTLSRRPTTHSSVSSRASPLHFIADNSAHENSKRVYDGSSTPRTLAASVTEKAERLQPPTLTEMLTADEPAIKIQPPLLTPSGSPLLELKSNEDENQDNQPPILLEW
ncbi:hypothetical protein HDV06_006801 [Boothiomyces sp. JEL0866]|nr:hypothetical protein HDV06_006801 [Boothiomyces sp. JEL0866]